MNKVFGSIISIILVLSFAMGIYCAGTTKTYDFKKHLESIASIAEEFPTFETLGNIWDDDDFRPFEHGMKYMYPYTYLNDITQGGASFNAIVLVPESDDWGVFNVVKNIMNGLSSVSYKNMYTLQFIGRYIIGFFQLVWRIMPTSGLVERGVY